MKTSILIFLILGTALTVCGQAAPLCGSDPTCTPDTSSSTYHGAALARAKIKNARGHSSALIARAPVSLRGSAGTSHNGETVIGSQSFNYTIPILNFPGRAGTDLALNLYYNSAIWDVDTTNATITFNADRDFPSYGFRLDFGYIEVSDFVILTEADGTKRSLSQGTDPAKPYMYYSTDGSHIQYNVSNGQLNYKSGLTVQYSAFPSNAVFLRPTSLKDANGNYISIAYVSGHDQLIDHITDTLGRAFNFNYDASNHLSSITQPLKPSGTKTWASFTWGSPYASGYTWYSFSGLTANGAPSATQISVLTGCTYPNGAGYKFTYGDWGVIAKVELLSSTGATRGYLSYDFPLVSAGSLTDAPNYTHQTISPDGTSSNTSVWIYSATKNAGSAVTSMAVTDPQGTTTTTALDPDSGQTSSVQIKDTSNTVLRTSAYTWTTTGFPPVSNVIDNIVTTLGDSSQQSKIAYSYDPWANTTDVYEYDFGLTLKRHTFTTYGTTGDYVTRHIVNLPTQILVKDGAGNTLARTDMAYDGTTLTPVTGASDHDDTNYGSDLITRGNLTSVTRYSNAAAGTGAFTRNFSYDTLGNLVTAQLDCCNQKVFSFSSATQYSAPDSVVRGLSGGPQYTTSYTYDPNNNLLLTAIDENGQTISYQHDSMSRLTQVLLPPQNGTQVQMNTYYGDAAASPTVTSSSTANSAVTVATLDGLGHVMQVDAQNGSTVVGSVRYAYDKLWKRIQTSNPFAPGETQVNTATAYDALGRVTRVTPPSGGYTQYQYYGNTVTITDPAGKQRKNYTDALGRLTEVDEPGWGDALPGSGSVTISGSERSKTTFIPPQRCPPRIICDPGPGETVTTYDTGTVTITVNGHATSYAYGQNDTAVTVASNLASAINGDSAAAVNATATGSTINLVARPPAAGAATNYSLSVSSLTAQGGVFGSGTTSFPVTASQALTGGEDAVNQSNAVLTATRRLVTTYSYDALDNLITASQGAQGPVGGQQLAGQPRSYSYDSLGRSTSVTTPESGTVNTYYTDAGNNSCSGDPSLPCRVQDARGIVKTLSYDGINRVNGVSYSDGTPSVTYTYDTGGSTGHALDRLTRITESANSQTFTYDNLGRITSVTQVIDSTAYTISYSYNLAGQLASITYPTGRVVTQSFDAAGRLSSIADGATTYMNGLSYNAAGETLGLTMGNGVQGTFSYNDHLQLAALRYAKSGSSTDILNLTYDYGTSNNGQIQSLHYYTAPGTEDATKSEYFNYDPWRRLSSAHTGVVNSTAGTWSMQWGYDRLGNRLSQTLTGGNLSVNQPNFTIDPATNHITNTGYSYDASGNLTSDSVSSYSYDGANRMTQFNGTAAAYTYFGPLRVKKVVGSTTTIYVYSGNKPIVEYTNGTVSAENIYAGSQLLAVVGTTGTNYYHSDHLSTRAMTDASGTVIRNSGTLPFGDTWYVSGTSTKWKFTSYERDGESGSIIDYANFRNYYSTQGRFMSADLRGGDIRGPQSLNGYSYVANDPVNLIDPLGLYCALWEFDFLVDHSTGEIVAFLGSSCVLDIPDGGPGGDPGQTTGGGGGPVGKVKDALKKLLSLIDQKCLDFLNSKGIKAEDYIKGLIDDTTGAGVAVQDLGGTVETTSSGPSKSGTFGGDGGSATLTIDNALTGFGNAALTVNSSGAFFNQVFKKDGQTFGLTVDQKKIKGGGIAAQLFILLHEVAHGTGVIGPDAGKQPLVDGNDDTLEKKCKDTVNAIKQSK